jgi:23S rRNA (guanine2445-N2)-methyltransferase / 23S rRNA (guanine2069-N7)-methyltransferase
LLAPGGRIVFSNNFQKFRLDGATLEQFEVEDITRATIPEDFARNARIHACYVLRPKAAVLAGTGGPADTRG